MNSRVLLRMALLCVMLLSMTIVIRAADPWPAPFNVSASAANTQGGALALDSQGAVHVVWQENGQIFHRVRAGGIWSLSVPLGAGEDPALAADSSGGVHLAYVTQVDGLHRIYYAVWQSASGWSTPVCPSNGGEVAARPAIAVATDGRIAIVWRESAENPGLLYLAQSNDGELWSVGPIPNTQGDAPSVVYDLSGLLYVAWEDVLFDGFPLEVWLTVWQLGTWTIPEAISYTGEHEGAKDPTLALGPDGVYLAWETREDSNTVIKIAVGSGSIWGEAQIRSTGGVAELPALAFGSDGRGHLVWQSSEALWHRSRESTGAWNTAQAIVTDQAGLQLEGLAAGTGVHVIWLAGAGNQDLYYSAQVAASVSMVHLPLVLK